MLSIAVPTYNRGAVLMENLPHLFELAPRANEILVVDQTAAHPREIEARLEQWNREGAIRWIRLPTPGVTHAMNVALAEARSAQVLFLDDDAIPSRDAVRVHAEAHRDPGVWAVQGQVLQPGEEPQHFDEATLRRGAIRDIEFRFNHDTACDVQNLMGGNLSVDRKHALAIGAFDENYTSSGYRFETDFALRIVAAGGRCRFAPAAAIRHLKYPTGGVRAYGDHRSSASPAHSLGDYYFARLFVPSFWSYVVVRLRRNIATRYHLRHPWTIPFKLVGELRGLAIGMTRARKGRKLWPASGARSPVEPLE